jgi:predicted outer membrane protein
MRVFQWHRLAWLAAMLCVVPVGCVRGNIDVAEDEEETAREAEGEVWALSVEAIAGILIAVNDGEILQAEIALERAAIPQVRAHAEQMIAEHTLANEALLTLLADLGTAPVESAIRRQITARGTYEAAVLRRRPQAYFDPAYMNLQIAAHRRALFLIDSRLIPAAAGNLILPLLLQARDLVAAHLIEAIQIRRSLVFGFPAFP